MTAENAAYALEAKQVDRGEVLDHAPKKLEDPEDARGCA
jgi:hypothetical protein